MLEDYDWTWYKVPQTKNQTRSNNEKNTDNNDNYHVNSANGSNQAIC